MNHEPAVPATTVPCCPTTPPAGSTCATDSGTCPGVRTEGLSVTFAGRPAITGVGLDAPSCRITALVGPSGCGKSTTLHCLNRLIDLVPTAKVAGRVLLGDTDVRAPGTDVAWLRTRVGMIFQRPAPFPLSIRRNLELPLREHGVRDRAAIAAAVEQSLRAVGLWDEVADRLDHPAQQLSGGQQQRLCLARALALRPEVLLLDEPCSALDPMAAGVVEDLIVSLRGFYTVVVVTHDLAQARRIADRVAIFGADAGGGRLLEQGPASEVLDAPRHPQAASYLRAQRF